MRDIMRFMNNLSTSMCTFSLRHYIHFFCHQLLMRFFLNFFSFSFFHFLCYCCHIESSHTMHILTHWTKKNIYRTEYFIHISFMYVSVHESRIESFSTSSTNFPFYIYVCAVLPDGEIDKKNYNFFFKIMHLNVSNLIV